MFYAVIFLCAAGVADPECALLTPVEGPYATEKVCKKSLPELVDPSIATYRSVYPTVGDIEIQGWCTPENPVGPDLNLPSDTRVFGA